MCRRCLSADIMSPDDDFAVVLSHAQTHIGSTRDALVTEHDVLVRPRHLTIHKSKHHQVEGRAQDRRGPTTTACWVTCHRSMLVFPCRRGKVGAAHTLHAACPRRLWRLWGHTCRGWRTKGRGKGGRHDTAPRPCPPAPPSDPLPPKDTPDDTRGGGTPHHARNTMCNTCWEGEQGGRGTERETATRPFEREKRRQGGRMPEEGGRAGVWGIVGCV